MVVNPWPLAWALVALNLGDCITTWIGVRRYHARELNPVGRGLFRLITVPGAMVLKMAVVCGMCWLLAMVGEWQVLAAFVLVYAALIGWNTARLGVHKRRAQGG
uniref:DUF5658 domain-containing protein n=1 Tax=viral metagenome TaxID=1070528 RepID=A0A6H1ZUP8_9ZZZZ